jgi:4-hydroxymandelate oxidase
LSPIPSDLANSFHCLADLETASREVLPQSVYEFVAGGAGDEITLRENEAAFDRVLLRPRVLRDVTKVDPRVDLFGSTLPHPILLAPTALQRMVHPDGEVATARGAGEAGAVFILSTTGTATVEECVAASTAAIWFLLYWQNDRGFNRELVQQVEAAGAKVLCVTVDTPTFGDRRRQYRAGFAAPADLVTPYYHDRNVGLRQAGSRQNNVLTWADIEWLRSLTSLPLLLKGLLDADDAAQAVDLGADGIIVSNHGARNLDTLPATLSALPAVAARLSGRVPILMDGGVRRGTDILKAIALGASAILIGRPYLYGLAVAGAAGVAHCIGMLRRELEAAMALTGRPTIGDIDRSLIW